MSLYNLVSLVGLFVLMAIAWAFAPAPRRMNVKLIAWGLGLQVILASFIFWFPPGVTFFRFLNDLVVKVIGCALEGAKFCFGPLAVPSGEKGSIGFILVTQGLSTIIFFAALMQLLYFLKIMPALIKAFARVFTRLMGVSGAESLCAASNIFVGIESTTTVLPYLGSMTRSELCTVITAGMATIASSVLGLYALMLKAHFPQIAGHLISASLLSAPAALMMSKLILPETGQPETLGRVVEPHYEKDSNAIEAIIRGATAGGKLMMGVIVMLMAFVGLVALINMGLDGVAGKLNAWFGCQVSLRLEHLLAYVFYPLTLIIGVPPADAFEVAHLLGIRAIMTEIPAYQQMDQMIASGVFHNGRSAVLASYALCGFAHVASIAIFVGGITALAPKQTQTLSRVALRALLAATLACLMTAAIAGVFYGLGETTLGLGG